MDMNRWTQSAQEVLAASLKAAEAAHYSEVEPLDLLQQLVAGNNPTAQSMIERAGGKLSELAASLAHAQEKRVTVQGGSLGLSEELSRLEERALKIAQKLEDHYLTVAHLLCALADDKGAAGKILREAHLSAAKLQSAYEELRGSARVSSQEQELKLEALKHYGRNVTQLAREGKLDPIIGRVEEIRRAIQVLSRRSKNNPVLIGEPGVGKTAIVEGLAQRIVSGDIPSTLKDKELIELDLSSMIAGAKYRGEFEDRLKSVLREVHDAGGKIILFIDELHTIVGAGAGGEGAMDAGNILKPALARGELHAIGATTLKEYREHIEKDPALARRFQTVLVSEPSVEETVSILRGIKERYEQHHRVRITDAAIIAAADLSDRYISDRFLPDKAIDLIDEAASRLRIELDSMPSEIDAMNRQLTQMQIEEQALLKESDDASQEHLEQLRQEIAQLQDELAGKRADWENQKFAIDHMQELKLQLEDARSEMELVVRDGNLARASELRFSVIPQLEQDFKAAM